MTDVKNDAPATEPGDQTTTKPTARPPMSMLEHTLKFQEREPAVFAPPWEREMIRNAIIDDGVPRGGLNDLVDLFLSLNREKLDPNYVRRTRNKTETQTIATTDEVVSVAVQKLGPDTIMPNGLPLADCTMGDVRKFGAGLAWLIAQFTDAPETARVGDLMRGRDWKKLAKV